jgi:pimeloyl-ACP methyl ester carboxylesterase
VERFTTSDGLGLAYRRWTPDERAPGPVVVLHHGFLADGALNWEAPGVVAALLAAGREVVAPDARGHGASDKPHDPARYGEARMAVDLGELLDHLGLEEIDLVGYSMGAIVAVLAAARDPRVQRMVIGGVGCAVVELGGVDTRTMDRRLLAEVLEADDPGPVTDPGVAAFRMFADAVGGDRRALAAQARSVHASPIALDRVTAPTLLLAGDADELASRPEVLVDALPDGRLEVVAGDHLGVVASPRFTAAVVEHLRRTP